MGTLKALRTKAEAENDPEFGEVIIISSPIKRVASLLSLADGAINTCDRAVLSHFRRVVKFEQLPQDVRRLMFHSASSHSLGSPVESRGTCESPSVALPVPEIVYILLCRASTLQYSDLLRSAQAPDLNGSLDIDGRYWKLRLPIEAPKSQAQASSWSNDYWPTIYKKHNPFGPQHNIITEAIAEISKTAHEYMELAEAVGEASCTEGLGLPVGAVVVDRSKNKDGEVVAVAGDARWRGHAQLQSGGTGNPMAHSAMRAISMVAKKRKCAEEGIDVDWSEHNSGFQDWPTTQPEMNPGLKSNIEDGGYLCLNMEIYMTHEPCVMCSMALLHSRFGKVIFGQRMPLTGGLVTEDGRRPGYGLFWLPSLNWKLLAWQWSAPNEQEVGNVVQEWHA